MEKCVVGGLQENAKEVETEHQGQEEVQTEGGLEVGGEIEVLPHQHDGHTLAEEDTLEDDLSDERRSGSEW